MHDDFSDWYRPCAAGTEINLTGDLLAKRWQGVEKAANNPGHEVLDMVRVALGRLGGSAAFLGKFRAVFKEADATFQMSGNDLELGMLAGSTLCWIFDQEGDEADEASLALLSAVSIAEGPEWIEPFVSHATAYLDGRLREIRKAAAILAPHFSAKRSKAPFDLFVAKLAENNLPQASEPAKQMGETILQAFTAITDAAALAISELGRQSDLRRQETDVLWWLTARVSRDLGQSFKQLKTPAASIVAGKELADLVKPPGILPAKSILQSIIQPAIGRATGKPLALHTAVNATTAEWREGLIKAVKIDWIADLCPVLAAVRHSLTTEEANGWTSAYKKAYGADPKTALQPVDLAHAIHRECLLARLAAE